MFDPYIVDSSILSSMPGGIDLQKSGKMHYIIKLMIKKEEQNIRKNRERIRESLKLAVIRPSQINIKAPAALLFNNDYQLDSVKKLKRKASLSIEVGEPLSSINDVYITRSFDELFLTHKKIGEGAQSVVYECQEITTAKKYAVKTIRNKDLEAINTLKEQYRILKNLHHPNIIQAFYLFISQKTQASHMACEYCPYEDLRFYMSMNRTLKQSKAAEILNQLLNGIAYLHDNSVCHRDIKPDNILYSQEHNDLKLIDFQISKTVKYKNQRLQMWTNTGTLHYKAPEMFKGQYNELVDIWAVGVICYQMITGRLPFQHLYAQQTARLIMEAEPDFQSTHMTPLCMNFIKKCLEKDPLKRITANQALKNPYILKHTNLSSSNSSPRMRKNSSEIWKKQKTFELSKCYNEDIENLINKQFLMEDVGIRVTLDF